MDIKILENFNGKQVCMTKTGTKGGNSYVSRGHFEKGKFSLKNYDDGSFYAFVASRGIYKYLKTSPIVKIIEYNEKEVTFETEGGFYKIEVLE